MVSIIDFYVLQKRPSKEGFDIVIGNPPYGANIDDLVSLYEELYPNTSHGYKIFTNISMISSVNLQK